MNGRDHLEDLGEKGQIIHIKMHLRETKREVADWMHLVQYRDQWRALMYLRVP
jgi:hypothetical protein